MAAPGGYLGGYPGHPAAPYRVTWVANRPPTWSPAPPVLRRPYYGPPAYPAPPRWGLPRLAWRVPTSVPGAPVRPARTPERVVRHARAAGSVLWLVAISALLAAGGEVWRYVLLVLGRDAELSADVVRVSDTVVNTGAWLAVGTGLLALALALRWLLGVREVAAGRAGCAPARPDWQVLLGVLLPGLNLFVAGSVLAEVEHTALRAPGTRPRPSRLVAGWWLAWVAGEVLAVLTVALGARADVQSRADGVLWHAATDLVAAALAVLTALLVAAVTGLVAPTAAGRRRERVLSVSGAPAPPLRAARPAGAAR